MRRAPRTAGFTLIETLVALVVVAVVMTVAQRGIVTARLGLDRAQSTLAAEAVARSIVETELDRLAAEPGVKTGETGGLAWSVTAEAIELPLPPPPPTAEPAPRGAAQEGAEEGDQAAARKDDAQAARWRPVRVTVAVANGLGRPFTVETIHLVKESE